ncbi:hypothetical protein D3C87_1635530 [compost metagenome]
MPGDDLDEAFALQPQHRLPHRGSAHAERECYFLLKRAMPGRPDVVEDPTADLLVSHIGEGR